MATHKPATRWLVALGVLLLFLVVAVVLDRTLTIDAGTRWLLWIGFVLLGLVAGGAVLWYLRPQEQKPVFDPGDDVMLAINGAREKLPRGSFASRALVLVLGPQGGAKTTLMVRSGGDPELLAGDAPSGASEVPVPTKASNLWLMQDAIFAELGGTLLDDATRWEKIVRMLRAPRVAAAVGHGEAAPRAAVVCVPCDLFYAGGGGEQLETLGRSLRLRLAEASRELGLAIPVYVVFTKMDRIPHFEPWVAPLTRDELRAPLGATLPFDAASTTGSYAERLAPRLGAAFQEIVDAVAARRVDLLARESVLERRYDAYELAREIRKIMPSATAFLQELCRPTQLGTSPQLRGFYFTGARPVLMTDVAQQAAARPVSVPLVSDASQVFRQPAPVAAMPAAAPSQTTRKVPEWVFVDRFLRDVILADTGAASVARGGVGVQHTRRALLGAAIAASLLLLVGVTVSGVRNRALTNRIATQARAVNALRVAASAEVTSPAALQGLDALRQDLDTVRAYVRDGTPLGYRFGLWNGESLLVDGRNVWNEGFRKQLYGISSRALLDSLNTLPAAGASDNELRACDWLKAYLITTERPDSSTREFLTPVLMESWRQGHNTDTELTALASNQFDAYADELPAYNPWPAAADQAVLTRTRSMLSRTLAVERVYQTLLERTDRKVQALRIPAEVPRVAEVMATPAEVRGSFTAKGAQAIEAELTNPNGLSPCEPWVMGGATATPVLARALLVDTLRTMYRRDYQEHWREFVASTSVLRAGDLRDAVRKLDILTSRESPLLAVLAMVARNTTTDSTTFQPVHMVAPPTLVGRFTTDTTAPYIDGLRSLKSSLEQVANQPPQRDSGTVREIYRVADVALERAADAERIASKLGDGFVDATTGSGVSARVGEMLLAPITRAKVLLNATKTIRATRVVAVAPGAPAAAPAPAPPPGDGGVGAALNAAGRQFCSAMAPLLESFPFSADGPDAAIADVSRLLAPGTGALWRFQSETLAPYLQKQGSAWVAKPGKVTLAQNFVDFFNRAARVSDALFADGSPTPKLSATANARGITSEVTPVIIFRHNGTAASFERSRNTPANLVRWPSDNAGEARLEAVFKKNRPAVVATGAGEWALFRLAAKAKFEGVRAEWPAPRSKDAVPVVVEFDPVTARILRPGGLGGVSCVSQVAQ